MISYLCILIYVVYLCERIVDIGQMVCYEIFNTLFCIYAVSHINITFDIYDYIILYNNTCSFCIFIGRELCVIKVHTHR